MPNAMPGREALLKAEELAVKALELADTLAEPHAALGNLKRYLHWDFPGSEKEFKRAIELDPSSFQAHYGYSYSLTAMGRHNEAIAEIRRAQQLDPHNLLTRRAAANHFNSARRYDEAIEQCQIALEIDPNYRLVYAPLAVAYEGKGQFGEAVTARQKSLTLGGRSEEEVTGLSDAYATSGREGYWRWMLDDFTEIVRQGGNIRGRDIAAIHVRLGEKDQAFEWLEKDYQEHEGGLIFIRVDPGWDLLRDDPRFQDLLRRMNLEP